MNEHYEIDIVDSPRPFAAVQHNFPCPCCRSRVAVHNGGTGAFGPCWSCQADGWALVDASTLGLWGALKLWVSRRRNQRRAAFNAGYFTQR